MGSSSTTFLLFPVLATWDISSVLIPVLADQPTASPDYILVDIEQFHKIFTVSQAHIFDILIFYNICTCNYGMFKPKKDCGYGKQTMIGVCLVRDN